MMPPRRNYIHIYISFNLTVISLLFLRYLNSYLSLLQGGVEGGNMMVGGGQGNEPMMMPGMPPGMHPGLLPTPDMFHMGPHPHPPEFMPPPFGPMGPPPPGMFPGNFPPNPPHPHDQSQRHHRPWFRGQNNGGGSSGGGGGTWRHPSKGTSPIILFNNDFLNSL